MTDSNSNLDIFDCATDDIEELPSYAPWSTGLYSGVDLKGEMKEGTSDKGDWRRFQVNFIWVEDAGCELNSDDDMEELEAMKVGDITTLSWNLPPGDDEESLEAVEKSKARIFALFGPAWPDAANLGSDIIAPLMEGVEGCSIELTRKSSPNKDDPENPYINQYGKNFEV